jgi:hypothetical protein
VSTPPKSAESLLRFLWQSRIDLEKVDLADFDSERWLMSIEVSIVTALSTQFFFSGLPIRQQYLPLLTKMFSNDLFHCNPRIRTVAIQFLDRVEDVIHPILPLQTKAFGHHSIERGTRSIYGAIPSRSDEQTPTLQSSMEECENVENCGTFDESSESLEPVQTRSIQNEVIFSPIALSALPEITFKKLDIPSVEPIEAPRSATARDERPESNDEMDIEIPEICIDDDGPDSD